MTGTDLVIQDDLTPAASTLFGTDDPVEVIARAANVAKPLADLVRKQRLSVKIGQGEHVKVEGWTLLGSMLGVFPVVMWTRPVERDEQVIGWEARAEARTRSGELVGSGESQCLRSEKDWANRAEFALRGMAQTRAVSRALRMPLGFVMRLAGFEPTPADEMSDVQTPGKPSTDVLEGTPMSDGWEDHPPDFQPGAAVKLASDAQKSKLNVLVGTLRETVPDRVTTERVYEFVAKQRGLPVEALYHRLNVAADDLHWSPLRDDLTKDEASALIERLADVEAERQAAA